MLYNEPGASKSNTSTLLLFCLVEKKISEKCCWLGVGVKRNDDQNTNNLETRFYLFTLHIIPYTSRLWFVCLFVCFLAPECRELIGYQETITFILNPIGILSKELAAKKKNNVRKNQCSIE